MNMPRTREEKRIVHIDTKNLLDPREYEIKFGKLPDPYTGLYIPIDDYNNVVKISLKTFKFQTAPDDEEYVFLYIKNIDGKVDSTTPCQNASAVVYFDGTKPSFFNDTEFVFNPSISKLNSLNVQILGSDGNLVEDGHQHSYVLEITYIEGNVY